MAPSRNDLLKGNIKSDPKRAERLEAELRENLKRRKARARAAADGASVPEDSAADLVDPSTPRTTPDDVAS